MVKSNVLMTTIGAWLLCVAPVRDALFTLIEQLLKSLYQYAQPDNVDEKA